MRSNEVCNTEMMEKRNLRKEELYQDEKDELIAIKEILETTKAEYQIRETIQKLQENLKQIKYCEECEYEIRVYSKELIININDMLKYKCTLNDVLQKLQEMIEILQNSIQRIRMQKTHVIEQMIHDYPNNAEKLIDLIDWTKI